jgi:small conductance mechanosensitive channel
MEPKTYLDQTIEFLWNYGPKALSALLLLVGGLWLVRRITRTFDCFLKKREVEDSLRPFLVSMLDVLLKVSLLLVVAGQIGIQTTSFIAIFSAVAFSIGLALQGSLGNFASGVLILLFRPYKVGDQVVVGGKEGEVAEIQIFNTILKTPQGKVIIIPNGIITQGHIENIGNEEAVRADVTLLLAPDVNISLLRSVTEEVVRSCPFGLPGREPFMQIGGLPRNAVAVEAGCWAKGIHYSDTRYYLHEQLKKAYDAVGIMQAKAAE